MMKHVLAVLAYVVATFATQATSHFAVNSQHYAAVGYLRSEPIFALGVSAMLIQGVILSLFYSRSEWASRSIMSSVVFSWLAGAFLVSYISLAEAAKYTVPGISSWLITEIGSGFVQFTIYGVLMGLIHARQPRTAAA